MDLAYNQGLVIDNKSNINRETEIIQIEKGKKIAGKYQSTKEKIIRVFILESFSINHAGG